MAILGYFAVTMQSNGIMPRRTIVPRRETSKITASNVVAAADDKKSQDVCPSLDQSNPGKELVAETREDASITPPSISGTITNEDLYEIQQVQHKPVAGYKSNNDGSFSRVESQHVPVVDGQKKVQFLSGKHSSSQGKKFLCYFSELLV